MQIKIILLILFFITCFAVNSFAYTSQTGITSGNFLKLNGSARSAGFGDAFIALADDASAIFWNPSGLALLENFIFSSTYMNLFSDINYGNIALAKSFNPLSVGLSLDYLNYGTLQETTASSPGGTGRYFYPATYVITGALAYKLQKSFSFGSSLKFINDNIDSNSISGYAADFGLLYNFLDFYSFGINAKNIVGAYSKSPLSSNLGTGIALNKNPFKIACDINLPNDNNVFVNFGLEYQQSTDLYYRLGLNSKNESGISTSFGLGIEQNGVIFDYAYSSYGDFGSFHRISIALTPEIKIPKPLQSQEMKSKIKSGIIKRINQKAFEQ